MVDSQRTMVTPTVGSYTHPVFKLPRPKNGLHLPKGDNQKKPQNGVILHPDDEAWNQQKARINNALLWLKSEMELLRVHDKLLEAQFLRVQRRIEEIRKDREEMRRRRRSITFCVEVEEEDHWEDWEIKEFEEAYKQERESSLESAYRQERESSLESAYRQERESSLESAYRQEREASLESRLTVVAKEVRNVGLCKLKQQQQQRQEQIRQLQRQNNRKINGIGVTLHKKSPNIFV